MLRYLLQRRFSTNPGLLPLIVKTPGLASRRIEKHRLDNGISALLISDPQTPLSGAALSVEVGSWHDDKKFDQKHTYPRDMKESRISLSTCCFWVFETDSADEKGTQKYPSENEYERYILDRNGHFNAYTASDHTLYYFSITPEVTRRARFMHIGLSRCA